MFRIKDPDFKCSVEDLGIICGSTDHCAKGLCGKHYERQRRNGTVDLRNNYVFGNSPCECGSPSRSFRSPYCQFCWETARKRTSTKSNKKKFSRLKNFLTAVKETCGCVDCGYRENVLALQFDHVKGERLFSLIQGTALNNRTITELMKCEVVCANCHAIRTHNRGQYNMGGRI